METESTASESFASLVRRWRDARGLSRPEAAKRLGISYRSLQSWELGDRTPRGLALQLLTAKFSVADLGNVRDNSVTPMRRRRKKKLNTSVCMSASTLRIVRQIARREDRSVSNVIERFIEQQARSAFEGK